MKILLQDFEQHIDEKMLKRGLSYFNIGAVTDCDEISIGQYEGTVSGSEEYTVQLAIIDDAIVSHSCDCPYDMGPICKHVVAVIFQLQKEQLNVDKPKSNASKVKKTKSVAQQIKGILKEISHEELMKFVRNETKNDRKFRNYFLASFGHLSSDQSKEFYQKQIQAILNTAAGRDGWIGWSDMKYVVKALQPFLENANLYLENNNFGSVVSISTALLEEMIKALEYGDDSNGDLGYFMDSSLELLYELTDQEISQELGNKLFKYCISSFNKGLFRGWALHLDMLRIAGELIVEEKQANIILNCLEAMTDKYEIEHSQAFKLNLLKRFKSEKEVEKFIEKHISNSSIRTDEIVKAFESKNFKKVIFLSKDGIICDSKDKPGLVKKWYNWLLKVAQEQQDNLKIIEYARWLFIDNYHSEQDYYQVLKNTIPIENWYTFLEELIIEIMPKGSWRYSEQIRRIYINEEWWDRLFKMMSEDLSLRNIEENEQYLLKDYSSELIELYSGRISNYLQKYVGRNHYQTACKYLRRMKKLGGEDKVIELIENLKTQYPRRRALLEELNLV